MLRNVWSNTYAANILTHLQYLISVFRSQEQTRHVEKNSQTCYISHGLSHWLSKEGCYIFHWWTWPNTIFFPDWFPQFFSNFAFRNEVSSLKRTCKTPKILCKYLAWHGPILKGVSTNTLFACRFDNKSFHFELYLLQPWFFSYFVS